MNTLRLLRGTAAYYLRRLAILAARLFGYDYRAELQSRLNERIRRIEAQKQSYPLFHQIQALQSH